ncbi:MAG: peptidoglycan-binding protein [Oscillospiraceae bacterium]|jgi:peptidoglycan hydrolase-like protein with peptidoglycan-binding domain|nr:peptidoglycan-binding protein [Oscillospiraceae bacterium]
MSISKRIVALAVLAFSLLAIALPALAYSPMYVDEGVGSGQTVNLRSSGWASYYGSANLSTSSPSGTYVRRLQEDLNTMPFISISADGVFGSGTEAAVCAFQEYFGLTVDGVAGSATKALLYQLVH